MNQVSLAFVRILFFVMLFVSTACNKMDRNLLSAAETPAPAAVQADDQRMHDLETRVKLLEAELKAVNQTADAGFGIPGGMNWD
jgi:hypothetical protein